MQPDDSRRIASILLTRVADGASSTEIAEAMVAALEAVDLALSPIIGKRGVAALLKRTLHLVRARHPWLRADLEDSRTSLDFGPLGGVLARQKGSEAAAAAGALLGGLRELLATLIGPLLTERLLASAWADLTSGPSA